MYIFKYFIYILYIGYIIYILKLWNYFINIYHISYIHHYYLLFRENNVFFNQIIEFLIEWVPAYSSMSRNISSRSSSSSNYHQPSQRHNTLLQSSDYRKSIDKQKESINKKHEIRNIRFTL